MTRTWLITGAASGLGREIARAALAAGDKAILADRNPSGAAEVVAAYPDRASAVQLDVTDAAQIRGVVGDLLSQHGAIDVLVNAAGRGHIGSVEDTPEKDLRSLMELIFYGPVALIQAVLPKMRERGSGAIVNISSQAGQMSVPGMSAYSAGKFALEGLSIALAEEVRPLGIKVMVPQPGAMRTNFAGPAITQSPFGPAYNPTVGGLIEHVEEVAGNEKGDPAKIARAIVAVLDADDTPFRLPFTSGAFDALVASAEQTLQERKRWEAVSRGVEFDT
ncbi:SDR family NAD(P)-dependent oxidoreductase [Sphingobium phenoxybenzoativorans]|uniref:SDR family NAD(P)-dependent oxidoreductase n=1 Tax=Sphingobium phenoxybenzoativorans TaxID=1592790 RepID=A0A975KBZ4_9SPHN|nr:SDR family NAD(P)-dependent oxidoreductase [Sphingobium phenoxybenzoativorans]QUT07863.1 SDR family NAD(P)-dependent oxidoreductase [Sphingobium phenoxybenzoativorans]